MQGSNDSPRRRVGSTLRWSSFPGSVRSYKVSSLRFSSVMDSRSSPSLSLSLSLFLRLVLVCRATFYSILFFKPGAAASACVLSISESFIESCTRPLGIRAAPKKRGPCGIYHREEPARGEDDDERAEGGRRGRDGGNEAGAVVSKRDPTVCVSSRWLAGCMIYRGSISGIVVTLQGCVRIKKLGALFSLLFGTIQPKACDC